MTHHRHSNRKDVCRLLRRDYRWIAATLLLCFTLSACASTPDVKSNILVLGVMDDSAIEVPFVRLVANSQDFDGMRVSIVGVLEVTSWRRCLYLTREHRSVRLPLNCVAIDLSESSLSSGEKAFDAIDSLSALDGHYVLIQGVYNVTLNGELLDWAGIIRDVNFVRDWGG